MIFCLSFNKLTERHFEKSPWPDADYVASLVDGGEFFKEHDANLCSQVNICE